jgi:hypothetical protein
VGPCATDAFVSTIECDAIELIKQAAISERQIVFSEALDDSERSR